MKLVLAAVLALCCAGGKPAVAGFQNGNELLAMCTSNETVVEKMNCIGYLQGLVDTMLAIQLKTPSPRTNICIPEGVSGGQIKDIVVKNLRNLPEVRHLDAASIVMPILIGTFPCGR